MRIEPARREEGQLRPGVRRHADQSLKLGTGSGICAVRSEVFDFFANYNSGLSDPHGPCGQCARGAADAAAFARTHAAAGRTRRSIRRGVSASDPGQRDLGQGIPVANPGALRSGNPRRPGIRRRRLLLCADLPGLLPVPPTHMALGNCVARPFPSHIPSAPRVARRPTEPRSRPGILRILPRIRLRP